MKKTLLALLMLAGLLACKEAPKSQTFAVEEPLLLLNRNVLERVKHDVQRDDATTLPAYRQLLADADGFLDGPLPSVMDKKQVPPSGDKHDYVSRGPYWWKNPNTADGLPYIRKDGETNPEYDDFTDSQGLAAVIDRASCLALAYYLSDDEKYAERAAAMLRTWFINPETRMNPNLNYAQQIPGICEGRGIGIIDTRYLPTLFDYEILLRRSNAWTDKCQAAFRQWMADYCVWLLQSDNGRDEADEFNNHGTWYDYQVVSMAMFTGEWALARKQLEEVTKRRLDSQLEADGSQPHEMARQTPWVYCSMNLEGFVSMAIIGERVGVNLWDYTTPKGATLRKAVEWFFPYLSGTKVFEHKIAKQITTKPLAHALMMASRWDAPRYQQQLDNLQHYATDGFQIASSMLSLTTPIIHGPVMSDADLFDELNLDFPGMDEVKQAVAQKDYKQAKKALATYLRTRPNSTWYFDWHDFSKPETRQMGFDTVMAAKVMDHHFGACRVPVQFGDTIDWTINGMENKYQEWTWQLSRHPYMATLSDAYWATGDERYAREWVAQMRSWMEQSPAPDYRASGLYSRWRTIETGIRTSHGWPYAFYHFLPSPSVDDETMAWLLKSFYEHAMHLRKFHLAGNWLTHEMNGLFNVGLLFPEFKKSAAWCQYGSQKLYNEEHVQFYPDGSQKELTPHYQGVCLTYFNDMFNTAQLFGYELPADFQSNIEPFYECYQRIMMPDGNIVPVNDSDWGSCRTKLAKGYEIFPNRKDFLYSATGGKEGTVPAYTSVWMPWAGWYVMRSGWGTDDMYAHFEVGPFSIGHQHEDKLSLMLHAYGRLLITEGARYAYDTSEWRRYIISARAHNLTRVDGKDQNRHNIKAKPGIQEISSPLDNRWITNEQFDFGEGWYDEGFGEDQDSTVTHYRALAFVKNKYWLLFDVFTPSDAAEHEYQTWFHFDSPDYELLPNQHAVASRYDDAANVTIYQARPGATDVKVVVGQTEPEVQGWVPVGDAQTYKCRPVATPTFTRRQAGQCVEPYLLYPTKPGESSPIEKVEMTGGEISIRFVDGSVDKVQYTIGGNALKELRLSCGGQTIDILK